MSNATIEIGEKGYETWEDVIAKNPHLAGELEKRVPQQARQIKDCSTVFSIVPFDIKEFKPGLYPGQFNLDICLDENKPSRLLLDGPSKHMMHVGGKDKPLVTEETSYKIAAAIVQDFLTTILYTGEECHPGITWIQGNVSIESFKNTYKAEYERIKRVQKNWFLKLVNETDSDWNRYHNLKVVSSPAKFACKFLGLDKEWMRNDVIAMNHLECPACKLKNPAGVAVCQNCKCILDAEKFKTLKFA